MRASDLHDEAGVEREMGEILVLIILLSRRSTLFCGFGADFFTAFRRRTGLPALLQVPTPRLRWQCTSALLRERGRDEVVVVSC